MEEGIAPEVACTASTPADIQLMVIAGYGVALIDQRTLLDPGLTTRPIAGIHWPWIQPLFTTTMRTIWPYRL
jgi:hypothetical protein